MSEKPGGYQRSTSGLIGAMIILLLVVFAFVLFRGLNREDAARPTPAIPADKVAQVEKAAREEGKLAAPIPVPLPNDWRVTSVSFQPAADTSSWHLGMLTDVEDYVGIEERATSVKELLSTYVDKDSVTAGKTVTIEGRRWESWTDSGGDYALTTRLDGRSVLVSGSAAPEVVQDTVRRLSLR